MRNKKGVLVLALVATSFVVGLFLATAWSHLGSDIRPKPLTTSSTPEIKKVTPETQVVLERAYTACGHKLISEFAGRNSLNGKSMKDLERLYNYRSGYLVSVGEDGTIVITQKIDGLCPECGEKRHLGVKDGRVVVYKGPSGYDVELLRVTRIDLARLPEQVRLDIMQGNMEFQNEDELGYALESFDEYE